MFEFKNVVWAVIIWGGGLALALRLWEFEKVIWIAFLSVFTLAAAAFGAMCIFVIGSHVGFANTSPGWGDVLTFSSILLAALIAFRGWYKADKRQTEERERVANSVARVLYAELEEATQSIIFVMQVICQTYTTPPAISFDKLTQNDTALPSHIKNLIYRADYVARRGVLKKDDLSQVSAMFNQSTKLGDNYITALVKYRNFASHSSEHLENEMYFPKMFDHFVEKKIDDFNVSPSAAKFGFYSMLENGISALNLLEKFRVEIPNSPRRNEVFDQAAEIIAQELIGQGVFRKGSFQGEPGSNERYRSVFDTLWNLFNEKVVKFEDKMNDELSRFNNRQIP